MHTTAEPLVWGGGNMLTNCDLARTKEIVTADVTSRSTWYLLMSRGENKLLAFIGFTFLT